MSDRSPIPILPVVDQPRWTRDGVQAGRCSGLQVNTLTVGEHQALLVSRGQRPLSLAEIAQIHGLDAAEAEAARQARQSAAPRGAPRGRQEKALRSVVVDGRRWKVTIEADDGIEG
ncbi:hypothetical protein [Caenispirillum bisanense]|uniref:Uncharacterized protein n=1 Tax=Caenispirillum bisanense TaxID=414052 RepID=A0A286H2J2_9PROT|nr:hypothetical protein [Caenispirillum bisanense]SOE01912.1 hypothetical protein SAMN05421508_1323 [Caenispirillum bisanense]